MQQMIAGLPLRQWATSYLLNNVPSLVHGLMAGYVAFLVLFGPYGFLTVIPYAAAAVLVAVGGARLANAGTQKAMPIVVSAVTAQAATGDDAAAPAGHSRISDEAELD
jgi:hypothetical protein